MGPHETARDPLGTERELVPVAAWPVPDGVCRLRSADVGQDGVGGVGRDTRVRMVSIGVVQHATKAALLL